jgi:hypothetical protein
LLEINPVGNDCQSFKKVTIMDWKELGKKVVSLGAPLLGTALGGPGGAALGTMVAGLFGADPESPGEILAKMQMDPEAAIKLREAELRHKERLEEIALERTRLDTQKEITALQEVNTTMRTEAKSEHWAQWGWRPYWGFISGTAFLAVCIFVCVLGYQAIKGGNPQAIGTIPMIVGAFTTLFAIPGGILGISAWGRNRLKEKRDVK